MRFPRALSHFLAGLTIFEGWIVSGCGGGSSGAPPAPQPPVAGSFAVQLNPASITVVAGDTVRTTVSIQAFNGFSGQVTLTVTGLPSGATALFASNPVGAGQSVDLTFTTTANTQAQTASLQIQGKSGTLTDVQTATLKVVGKPTGMAPLSGYVAVDGPLFDSTYDPVHRLAFAANPQLNRIEVLSPETLQRVATIPVPQAVTLDTTPDGSLLWVGTSSYYLFAVDPATLQVVNRVLPTGGALGTLSFGRTLSTTSNGSLLINRGSKLAQFFPATGQVVDRSREASAGALFRSADGSKVLDASSIPTLYDALTDSFLTNPSEQGTEFACIRPDGSQVAMLGLSKSTPGSVDLVFLDAQLKEIGRIPGMNFAGLPVYSRDGRFLYLPMDITILRQSPEIAVFDTRSMTRVGSVPDIFRSSDPPTWHFSTPGGTTLIAADANGVLMGPGPCGFDFVDARNPHSLSGNAPGFSFGTTPRQGPLQGGTAVTLSGSFTNNPAVFFGGSPAAVLSSDQATIQVLAPLSASSGPVNVVGSFPSGWTTLAPYAFSYGPQILEMIPRGDAPAGGSRIVFAGYGLDFPAAQITVTIGGRPARVVSSELGIPNVNLLTPLFFLQVDAPSGAPGPVDVVISTPAGSTTLPRVFRYSSSVQNFPVTGLFNQVLYDRFHRLVYLLDKSGARVHVFSPAQNQFVSSFVTGPSPAEMALTVDGSLLIVANGDASLSLIDPLNPVSPAVIPIAIPGDTHNMQPVHLAPTASNRVFIQYFSSVGGSFSALRLLDLNMKTFSTPGDPGCSLGVCLLETTAAGHKVFFVVLGNSGGDTFQWDDDTSTFVNKVGLGGFFSEMGTSEDGNRFFVDFNILDSSGFTESKTSLADFVVHFSSPHVPGVKLHPSGSLLYMPLVNGIQIYDLQRGTVLRSYSGLDVANVPGPHIAIDDSGQTLYVISSSGLQVIKLDSVPLSIGHATPSVGPSGGGTSVTIRGSGFQSGTQVTIGTVPVSSVFVDSNTLRVVTPPLPPGRVRMSVSNPDGQRYDLDVAFQLN